MNYSKSASWSSRCSKTSIRAAWTGTLVFAAIGIAGFAELVPVNAGQDGSVVSQIIYDTSNAAAVQPALTPPRKAIADLDGDGKSDLSVFRETDGNWYFINSSTDTFVGLHFGSAGDQIVPGDYDGDGRTDCAVWRPSNGTWYILYSTGGFTQAPFGLSTDLPAQGDFDGDGKTDIAVFRPSTGVWYLLQSTAGFGVAWFGSNGDQPVPGDYDGDHKTDIAVFRPSTGVWYLQQSTAGFAAFQFGISTDKVDPADFDGDGKTDLGIFRNGIWYLLQSTAGFAVQSFGSAGDIPAAADFDSDITADISVFRPSTGVWYQLRSTSGFFAQQFGLNGDKPVPAGYVPALAAPSGPTLTPAQRLAADEAVRATFESLNGNPDKNAVNQAVLDFIRTRPEFAASGLSDDSCVWATFTDGVELVVINNRDPADGPFPLADTAIAPSGFAYPKADSLPDSQKARLLTSLGPLFQNPVPNIRTWMTEQNYSPPSGEGATVELLKNVGGDGVFYIDSHGGTSKSHGGFYFIGTTTEPTEALDTAYEADIKPILEEGPGKDRVRLLHVIADYDKKFFGSGNIEKITYGFSGEFVRKYWGQPLHPQFSPNSFVFIDACGSASAAATGFRAIVQEKGVSVYAGWSQSVKDSDMARFIFDRLLGANKVYPEGDGFKQRPFDYQSAKLDSLLHLPPDPHGAQIQFFATPVGTSDGFQTLAPSIWRMEVNEYSNELTLLGTFGDDPGKNTDGLVFVGGLAVHISSWDKNQIVCDLNVQGLGSSGEVVVFVRTQKSNVAHLTEWEGDFTHTVRPTTVPPGNEQQADTYHIRFRSDIRYSRFSIHNPPTFLLPGEQGRSFFATENSLFTYTNSGSYTTLDSQGHPVCTETWSGHDSFNRGPLIPAPGSRTFYFLGLFPDDHLATAQLSVSSLGLFENTVCVDGTSNSRNDQLYSPRTTDSDPDTFNLILGSDFNIVGTAPTYTDVVGNVHNLRWNLAVKAGTAPDPNSPR